MRFTIEYCTSWGYRPKAMDLADKLLGKYKNDISSLELIPSSGGVFEVNKDGSLIFSKKEKGRFPEENEIITTIWLQYNKTSWKKTGSFIIICYLN